MTLILLWRILLHIFIVEAVPAVVRGWCEQETFKLFHVAQRRQRLMPKRKARVGKPFLGKAQCLAEDCGNTWTVFTKEGCDPHITLECGNCGTASAILVDAAPRCA